MKAELINFELWFTNSAQRNQHEIYELTVQQAISDIKAARSNRSVEVIVGLLVIDGFLHRNNEDFYLVLKKIEVESKKIGIKKIFLLVGMCSNYQNELDKRSIDIEIIEWNFPVNHAYLSYKHCDSLIGPWNWKSDKFFFLTGIAARPNRIGLIKRLYDRRLLHKNGIWSFFPPWSIEDIDWCKNYCGFSSESEFTSFVKSCANDLDGRYSEAKYYSRYTGKELRQSNILDTEFVNDMCYISPEFFKNTSISIVSDGPPDGLQCEFFTEKLWRTVLNLHPFILAENSHRYAYAKSLGLKTFEEYTNFNCFLDDNEELRLNQVVDSLIYFLENKEKFKEQILQDLEHNKNVFYQLVNNNLKTISWLSAELQVPCEQLDRYLKTTSLKNFIRIPEPLNA